MSTPITITGNLTNDPEIKFSGNGVAIVNLSIAVNDNKFNKETNTWEDGNTTFFRCTAFKQLAENIADSLEKGMRVMVRGKIEQNSYVTKEGEKRTDFQVVIEDAAPSLKNASAKVNRNPKNNNTLANSSQQDDPWAAPLVDVAPF